MVRTRLQRQTSPHTSDDDNNNNNNNEHENELDPLLVPLPIDNNDSANRLSSELSEPEDSELETFEQQQTRLSARATRLKMSEHTQLSNATRVPISNQLKPDGKDFKAWKLVIGVFLSNSGVMDVVTGKFVKPADLQGNIEKWESDNNLALAIIIPNISMELLAQISTSTAAIIWCDLDNRFGKIDRMSQALAIDSLRNKKLGSGAGKNNERETIDEHIGVLRKLRSEAINTGATVSDEDFVLVIITSLTGEWTAIGFNSYDETNPEKLIQKLLHIEEQRSKLEISVTGQPDTRNYALRAAVPSSPLKSTCHNCNKYGHIQRDCYEDGGGAVDRRPSWFVSKKEGLQTTKTVEAAHMVIEYAC